MNITSSTTKFIISTILLSVFSISVVNAAQSNPEYAGAYKAIDDPQTYMDSEFKKAKAENKKLIFVLGGNWCHDSRSLAKKLDDATLSQTIKKNYRVSMVDVGFLNQGFAFTERANMSTFYATPTVLIFDPETGKQINAEDMHIWSAAGSISQKDAQAYFDKYSKPQTEKIAVTFSQAQRLKLAALAVFIRTQEQRIKTGYKIIGPMLERSENEDKDENFGDYWKALANIRMNLPKDISNLREQITVASDIELAAIEFPEYSALPWEK